MYRRSRLGLIATLVTVASAATLIISVPAAAAGPSLHFTAPSNVRVGEAIVVTLTLRGAAGVAGYESQLLFDTSRARVRAFREPRGLKGTWGRSANRLGPLELQDGLAFGAYSCPIDCVTRKGVAQGRAASGNLVLATVELQVEREGPLDIRLGETKFVDAAGSPIIVGLPARRAATVQVGTGGPSGHAPAGKWKLTKAAVGNSRSADSTRDGRVSSADLAAVGMDWMQARESGQACGPTRPQDGDVTGDGCVDVSDMQFVSTRLLPATVLIAADPAVFTVTSDADDDDDNPGDGTCETSAGVCTLRAAIREANAHDGPDTIVFNIPGAGVHTIHLSSSLPFISGGELGGTTIDGYAQPGASPNSSAAASNAVIRIQLEGPGEATQFAALKIVSPGNKVRGLALYKLWRKIWINAVQDTTIAGNFVGTDATGAYRSPSRDDSAFGGIELDGGASQNVIGGSARGDRNVISGNPAEGIHTRSLNNQNRFLNNIAGLTPDGTRRLGNFLHGIDLNFGSSYNVVGGTGPGEGNVLSGNDRAGVEVSHGSDTRANQVLGNLIGLDPSGAATAFSGNGFVGVHVEDGVTGTEVAHNYIGNNGEGGIAVKGGEAWGTGVVSLTTDTSIHDNHIGLTLNGTAAPNGTAGVDIRYHARHTTVGPGNVIANNPIGVFIADPDVRFNTVTRNSIYGNAGNGIDLFPGSRTDPNDWGDADGGANDHLNHPLIHEATPSAVRGTACSNCTVEVFRSDGGAGAYGEGRAYVGSAAADSEGAFNVSVVGVAPGTNVTATATDPEGNTSEFALDVPVTGDGLPPQGSIIASDSFSRSQANGWGQADSGGVYTVSTNAADFGVTGQAGTMIVPSATVTRRASLLSLSARDSDARVKFRADKAPAGGSFSAYLIAREASPGNEYRARLRAAPDGSTFIEISRLVGGVDTPIGTEMQIAGLTYSSSGAIWLRFEVAGANPTTLRARAWTDGGAEPGAWAIARIDSTASLQRPGSPGLMAYVGASTTNAPIAFSFDDYRVLASRTADLQISLTATPNPVWVGGHLEYAPSVRNDGPGSATGVTLVQTISTNTTFLAASPGCALSRSTPYGGHSVGGQVTCILGTLPSGAVATRRITVGPIGAATISSSARVSSMTVDPESASNSSSRNILARFYPGQTAKCTRLGTAASETLSGTSRADVICAFGGNDIIAGGGGNDQINGGPGIDRAAYGPARAGVLVDLARRVTACYPSVAPCGQGRDRLIFMENASGASYADKLLGSGAANQLYGFGGADQVYGYGGNDRLFGGIGNDRLYGGTGNDSVYGESGNDYLSGESGNDYLNGGPGTDRCLQGTGTGAIRGCP
jgi:CSLREA domain-containing protein/uncharacterized repeat protein (TIGR01451 family)